MSENVRPRRRRLGRGVGATITDLAAYRATRTAPAASVSDITELRAPVTDPASARLTEMAVSWRPNGMVQAAIGSLPAELLAIDEVTCQCGSSRWWLPGAEVRLNERMWVTAWTSAPECLACGELLAGQL